MVFVLLEQLTMDFDLNENIYEVSNEEDIDDEMGNISQEDEISPSKEFVATNPYVGLEFNSHIEAHSFYKSYAKHLGFGIKTKNSRRSKVTGEFIDIKYVCTRYGKKKESTTNNPRPCLKRGCEAKLNVKRKQDGKWIVYDFVKEHNHDLFPNYSHYFPCHRSISLSQQSDISNLKAVGIKTSKVFAAMAKQHGGYESVGFQEKDIRNHLDKQRRLELESGDANAP